MNFTPSQITWNHRTAAVFASVTNTLVTLHPNSQHASSLAERLERIHSSFKPLLQNTDDVCYERWAKQLDPESVNQIDPKLRTPEIYKFICKFWLHLGQASLIDNSPQYYAAAKPVSFWDSFLGHPGRHPVVFDQKIPTVQSPDGSTHFAIPRSDLMSVQFYRGRCYGICTKSSRVLCYDKPVNGGPSDENHVSTLTYPCQTISIPKNNVVIGSNEFAVCWDELVFAGDIGCVMANEENAIFLFKVATSAENMRPLKMTYLGVGLYRIIPSNGNIILQCAEHGDLHFMSLNDLLTGSSVAPKWKWQFPANEEEDDEIEVFAANVSCYKGEVVINYHYSGSTVNRFHILDQMTGEELYSEKINTSYPIQILNKFCIAYHNEGNVVLRPIRLGPTNQFLQTVYQQSNDKKLLAMTVPKPNWLAVAFKIRSNDHRAVRYGISLHQIEEETGALLKSFPAVYSSPNPIDEDSSSAKLTFKDFTFQIKLKNAVILFDLSDLGKDESPIRVKRKREAEEQQESDKRQKSDASQ